MVILNLLFKNITLNRSVIRKMSHQVFVYGTLKRNEPNHHWLTNPDHGCSKFVSEGHTKYKYPLIIATKYNIPFVLYSPGDGHHINGEIYTVDDTMLSKLDILEDHPKWYIREITDIVIKKSESNKEEISQCWLYFLKNFRPDLLRRELYDNYSSSGPHGLRYLESEEDTLEDDEFNDLLKK